MTARCFASSRERRPTGDSLRDLPQAGRAFLATKTALFELEETAGRLQLVRLEAPKSAGDFHFASLQVAPDGLGTVAFTREGIYRVEHTKLRPLWISGYEGQIDTTGHTTPVEVRGWNGTLFATHQTFAGVPRFHLLTLCGAADAATAQ